ncbi:UbiA family prenyltransferase [Actinophytocola sp.]|uniref:UbiA family prenyltransferase n=1 Tax=Actinophytocola sp. TaxID=1872138 RepID=UPI002ED9096E
MTTKTLSQSADAIGFARSVRLAWHEARPVVQIVFMLRFLAGAALGATYVGEVAAATAVTAALSWLAATWAVYLLNGVADVVEDRANGSTRPIARGDLPEETAERIVWALATTGLVLGALVSPVMLLLVVLMLAVGWAYSMGPRPCKQYMPGFLVSVFALGVLTYLAGWQAAGAGSPHGPVLVFGIAMSGWMGLAGWTKDLSDTTGDRLAGRRTLPVLLGEWRARVVMAAAASLVGWTFVLLSAGLAGDLLPVAVVVCVGSAVLALVATTPLGQGDRAAKRRPYRVFMVTQYATHLTLFLCLALDQVA